MSEKPSEILERIKRLQLRDRNGDECCQPSVGDVLDVLAEIVGHLIERDAAQ